MAEFYTCANDCVFVLYGWGRLIAGYSLSTDCTPEEFTKCMPECCSESKCQTKTEDQCQLMTIDEIINGSVCRTIWFRSKVFKRMSPWSVSICETDHGYLTMVNETLSSLALSVGWLPWNDSSHQPIPKQYGGYGSGRGHQMYDIQLS